jgi:hypothetical protein
LDAAGLGRVWRYADGVAVFSDEELARRRTFPKAPCGAWWASVLDEGDALWSASPDPLQELLAALGHA